MALLTTKDLQIEYPTRNGPKLAVDNVSLSIERGEIFGLVGESSSGKSSLARLMIGLHHPDSGKLTFSGQDFSHKRDNTKRKFVARQMQQMQMAVPQILVSELGIVGKFVWGLSTRLLQS